MWHDAALEGEEGPWCHAVALAMNKDSELSICVTELTRASSERSRTCADLALYRNRQQTTKCKAFDHGFVEPLISKEVAKDQIHGRTFGKSVVEIHHFEAATVGDAGEHRQPTGEIDCHRRDVNSPDLHPPAGEPHCTSATTTSKL